MKRIFFAYLSLTVLLISCGSSEPEIPRVDKITPIDTVFNYDSLTNSGFKKSKSYKIDELPEAKSAYYGWKEVGSEGIKDFEIRIYNSHKDAVEFGVFFADEATGENAIIRKSDASWKEGIKDRRTISTPTDGGSIGAAIGSKSSPKYGDYIIYGNLIILCEGWDTEESISRCSSFVQNLE
ncbi:MAG: DUF6810 family protein [Chloroflexota bacterium]|nr:DUF6810 family protein [Chloroflexota bacterium]